MDRVPAPPGLTRLGLSALAIVVCAGCAGPPPQARRPEVDPAERVEAVLTAWYEAIAAHDSVGIAAPLLPEFFILEDTAFVPRDQLVRGIMAGAGLGHQTSARDEFRTVVTDSVAWTTFRNRERWLPRRGDTLALEMLETVVFRKRDGRWMMERYHATRLEGRAEL